MMNVKKAQFANLYMKLDYQISLILSKDLTKSSGKKLEKLLEDRQKALDSWKKEPNT